LPFPYARANPCTYGKLATESLILSAAISKALSSLEARVARNVSYVGFSQLIVLFLSIGTITLLARILTPEDFGIVALGLVFVNLFYSLQDFGIIPALIQRDSRVDESISTGLSLRWIVTLIVASFVIVLSPFIAGFFGNPPLESVLIALTLNLFVLSFGFTSQTVLMRSMRFSELSVAFVVQYAVYSVTSISLAFFGFSFWSLVLGTLSGSLSYVLVLRTYERSRFGLKMDIQLMRELLGFGKYVLVTGLMLFVVFNVDQIVIARVMGLAGLGVFVIAVRFGRTLGEQIASTVSKVMFPTMARMKDDPKRLGNAYVHSLRMVALVALPLSVLLSALASMFVQIVLGSAWLAVVVPLSILSFQGFLNALQPSSSNVLAAIGKPNYVAMLSTLQAAVLVAAIYPVAVTWGIDGVCVLTTLLSCGVLVSSLVIVSSALRLSVVVVSRPILPALMSGLIMYVALVIANDLLPSNVSSLFLSVVFGFAVYAVFLHALSRGRDTHDFLSLLRGLVVRSC
jgi:PST family polysaccharide transporter